MDAPVLVSISPSVSKKFKNNSLEIIFPTVDFPDPIGPTINIFIILFQNFNTLLLKIPFLILKLHCLRDNKKVINYVKYN